MESTEKLSKNIDGSTENLHIAAAVVVAKGAFPYSLSLIRKPDICRFHFAGVPQDSMKDLRDDYLSGKLRVNPKAYMQALKDLKKFVSGYKF